MELLESTSSVGTVFFLSCGLQDQDGEGLTSRIDDFRWVWGKCVGERPFRTLAICVLPAGFQAVVALPAEDDDLKGRLKTLKTRFARLVVQDMAPSKRLTRQERYVWQKRDRVIALATRETVQEAIMLCTQAAVKAGLVEDARDWPFVTVNGRLLCEMEP